MAGALPQVMPQVNASNPAPSRRLHELDSLRGVAAMTVVLLHFRDMWVPEDTHLLVMWKRVGLILLLPFVSGAQAVIVFFMMSGLVLALPYLRTKVPKQPYTRFLLRRILRVYGPYLVALALALGGAAIWHGHPYHGAWAAGTWSRPLDLRLIAQHVGVLGVYDAHEYNFVIWSLVHELRISIIFPFLFWVTIWLGAGRSMAVAGALSAVALLWAGHQQQSTFMTGFPATIHYTGIFIVGILIASRLDRLHSFWCGLRPGTKVLFALTSMFLYTFGLSIGVRAPSLLAPGRHFLVSTNAILGSWVVALGAAGILVIAVEAASARRLLATGTLRFLGRISYSLYLVHPVVLLALTFACGRWVSMWLQLPLYLILAIGAGWVFCLLVEEPFTRFSRAV